MPPPSPQLALYLETAATATTTELCTSRNVKSILCPAGRRKQVAMRFPERARRQAASCREVLARAFALTAHVRAKPIHHYGLKSALDAQTRIGTYNAHLERLAAQQPVKVKERTDKEAALTRKEQENHTLQNEINLRNKQLETMDRPALQDKKNKLDAGRENLLQALSALFLVFTG